jgi:hypothetical protein
MWSCCLGTDFKEILAGGGTAPVGGPLLLPLTLSRALFPKSRWFIATGVGTGDPNGCLAQAAKVTNSTFQYFAKYTYKQ